jgi:hypothetical protein
VWQAAQKNTQCLHKIKKKRKKTRFTDTKASAHKNKSIMEGEGEGEGNDSKEEEARERRGRRERGVTNPPHIPSCSSNVPCTFNMGKFHPACVRACVVPLVL